MPRCYAIHFSLYIHVHILIFLIPWKQGFLGNRYGSRPFPAKISIDEFNILRRASFTACKSTSLLDEWYQIDYNSVPPIYVLKPITAKYTYYNDESEENEEKRKKVRLWCIVYRCIFNMKFLVFVHGYG